MKGTISDDYFIHCFSFHSSGGVVMCMTANGRPSGEALVRFTNKEQRDLALKRNGMKFGARSIEVCTFVVFVRCGSLCVITKYRIFC